MDKLDEILKAKKTKLRSIKKILPFKDLLKKRPPYPIRNFKEAIAGSGLNIIAEIKKASPTLGVICEEFNPIKLAKIYEAEGAVVVSILTEEDYFKGKLDYINMVKREINLPILRKDFIFEPYQVYESYVAGADAILLIANILSLSTLKKLIRLANKLGMHCLVEVHTKKDLEKAKNSGAEIIGINNRDLKTFKVDLKTTERLIKYVPSGCLVISESGIKTRQDVLHLQSLGVNAVLIGEAFLKAKDIKIKIREIMGVR